MCGTHSGVVLRRKPRCTPGRSDLEVLARRCTPVRARARVFGNAFPGCAAAQAELHAREVFVGCAAKQVHSNDDARYRTPPCDPRPSWGVAASRAQQINESHLREQQVRARDTHAKLVLLLCADLHDMAARAPPAAQRQCLGQRPGAVCSRLRDGTLREKRAAPVPITARIWLGARFPLPPTPQGLRVGSAGLHCGALLRSVLRGAVAPPAMALFAAS